MTKVEQIDWSKFKVAEPRYEQKVKVGTKNFKQVKETRRGFIKTYKMADKHLISEHITNIKHVSSIKHEI